ncbi:HAD hydrolase-like protein [Patescibacteria group bacterium AH-259-L07]|nr:HAD hydrolase-like protein [Patescibacteria group bacterium AH-259-L07]
MKRIIIFDFNRTLYDPDTNMLVPDAKFVLCTLLERKFALYLISHAARSRKKLISTIGIRPYFTNIVITREKSKKNFKKIVQQKMINREQSFIIGDRIRKEIVVGNNLGLQTIWVRIGKFADEYPREENEQPTYTVGTLKGILKIIH